MTLSVAAILLAAHIAAGAHQIEQPLRGRIDLFGRTSHAAVAMGGDAVRGLNVDQQVAERMVERTEVVRSARRTAEKTVEDAEDRARAMRLETEDYIDQKLAGFEVVLDRTMAAVQKGRERLQVVVEAGADPDIDVDDAASEFFNQDSN